MGTRFKPHIAKMVRYQTSLGRDLVDGLRLDRNERVSNFSEEVFSEILTSFPPHMISASPEAGTLYGKLANFLNIDRSNIYLTCGITEGLKFIYETTTSPGDNIIVLDPTYPMYSVYADFYGLEYRKLSVANDLQIDIPSLYKSIDQNTALVAIPNPNLPVETSLTKTQIRPILEYCQKTNTIVVIDEAYHYYGTETVIDLVDQYDNLIVMRTFSKAFGGAGLRLGFMVSQPKNIAYFSKTRSIVDSNAFSLLVAEYLIDHPQLMHEHVEQVKQGATLIQHALTTAGFRWVGGNFTNGILIFLNTPEQSKKLVAYLRDQKIYVRGSFEPPYDSCIRVSIGHPTAMQPFINAITRYSS